MSKLTDAQIIALRAAQRGELEHHGNGLRVTTTGRKLHVNTRNSLIANGLLTHGTLDEGFPLQVTEQGIAALAAAGYETTTIEHRPADDVELKHSREDMPLVAELRVAAQHAFTNASLTGNAERRAMYEQQASLFGRAADAIVVGGDA